MRVLKQDWFGAALVLVLLTVAAFWDLLWLPNHFFIGGHHGGNDLNFLFMQWWDFAFSTLRAGELPLWNPLLYAGIPFIANPQPALFYPPVWLLGVLPLTRGITVLYLFHIWLAAFGMYLWLRSEAAQPWGALLGAGVFAFSGYFFVRIYAGHIGVIMVQAWLPWILWGLRAIITRRRWELALLASVPVALSLLAGHTASFLYVALIAAAYALYSLWQQRLQGRALLTAVGLLALLGGVGLALSAIQLLPTLQLLALSTRQGAGYDFAAGYAWPPGYLLTLLIPNFFGNPAVTGYWGDSVYEELIFYVGILPLLFVAFNVYRRTHRLTPLLLGLSIAALLLAFGALGGLHRVLYNFIPLFRVARAPARAGFVFTFTVAALSGFSVSWLLTRKDEADGRGFFAAPWPWIVVTLALLLVGSTYVLFTLQRDANPEVGRLWHLANYTAVFLTLFSLSWALLSRWLRPPAPRYGIAGLALGLILVDLWGFGRGVVQPLPLTHSDYWTRVAAALAEREPGRVLPWGLGIFEQNRGMDLGIETVLAYDPLQLQTHHELTTSDPDPRARAYDLLAARYLVASYDMAFTEGDPASPTLIAQEGDVWIYERPHVFPPAWLVHELEVQPDGALRLARLNAADFDPQTVALLEAALECPLAPAAGPETARVIERGNHWLLLEVQATAPALLVLSEVHYPGWQATVDGQSVPVVRVNHALRGVCVPAGTYTVAWMFRSPAFYLGAVITGLGGVALGIAVGRLGRKR